MAVAQWPEHVCVIADADVPICDWSLRQAIQLAATHDRLYLPHNSVCRMTRLQSERFLKLPPDYRMSGRLYRNQRTRAAPGGIVGRPRRVLLAVQDGRAVWWLGQRGYGVARPYPADPAFGPAVSPVACPCRPLQFAPQPLPPEPHPPPAPADGSLRRAAVHASVPMQQHPNVVPALRSLCADYPLTRILEIGTGAGGFAMLLRELCPEVPLRSCAVTGSCCVPAGARWTVGSLAA